MPNTVVGCGSIDPMTMSLPNVLADPRFPPLLSRSVAPPYHAGKAASGDNMLDMGNGSEGGSYRIGANGEVLDYDSSQSDVCSSLTGGLSASSAAAHVKPTPDPRVYYTNFTTKRVGNVIVKKVVPSTIAVKPTRDRNYENAEEQGSGQERGGDTQRRSNSRDKESSENYYYTCLKSGETDVGSSVSAPVSSSNRYMVASSNYQQQPQQRIRVPQIPVPIDGPLAEPAGAREFGKRPEIRTAGGIEPKTANIIRPVVLSSVTSEQSTSSTSSTILRRPILVKPTVTTPSSISSASVSSARNAAPPSSLVETSVAITASSSQASSTSLVGTIINNDNNEVVELDVRNSRLVGTVERDDLENLGGRMRGEKPKVPPKPSMDIIASMRMEEAGTSVADSILQPLDSILNEAEELSKALEAGTAGGIKGHEAEEKLQAPLQPPSSISIESEDLPDVKTMHLFSDEPTIPYTLTVRNISSAAAPQGGERTAPSTSVGAHGSLRQTASGGGLLPRFHPNRKSLDLVRNWV